MTRKKLNLAYIRNESARKATFRKRKKGFLKKMYELTTLCEIKACAIMYSPYDEQPSVWPNPIVAEQVLDEFRRLPEVEKCKRMVDQQAFLRQRIKKESEHLKKQEKDNREKEMTGVMFHCLMGKDFESLNMLDLNDLGWLIDRYIKVINHKIEIVRKEGAGDPPVKAPKDEAGVDPTAGVLATMAPALAPPLGLPPPAALAPPLAQPPPPEAAFGGGMENMGMEQLQALQGQQWLMDLVNPQDEMAAGFFDDNLGSTTLWSSSFFHGRI